MPRLSSVAGVLVVGLIAGPLSAQTAQRETAGFWSYPSSPNLSAADLGALCRTGFALVYSDGTLQSYLRVETPTGSALLMDSEIVCNEDDTGATICSGWVDEGDGQVEQGWITRYSLSDGAVRAETSLGDGEMVVTFPQRCPDSAVREALELGVIAVQSSN